MRVCLRASPVSPVYLASLVVRLRGHRCQSVLRRRQCPCRRFPRSQQSFLPRRLRLRSSQLLPLRLRLRSSQLLPLRPHLRLSLLLSLLQSQRPPPQNLLLRQLRSSLTVTEN